jgi:hypothetical protein
VSAAVCSCGEPSPHVIARRRTLDGYDVCLWDDGAITGALGYRINGVPMRRPRTEAARALARTAGRLLLGEACIRNLAELGPVYAAAERAAREDGLPGTLRRYLNEARLPTLAWTVLHADRDGRPVERVARLPRLRWPGLVVWDFCGGPGSANGRYVLMTATRDGTAYPTGLAFRNLAALWAHLRDLPAPEVA